VEFAGKTMQAFSDGFFLQDIVVDATGGFSIDERYLDVTIGFASMISVQPNLESPDGGEAFGQRMRRRKITKVLARMHNTTQFSIDGREFSPYRQGDNMDIPLAARTETHEYRQAGRSWDPNFEIKQDIPGPFEILELTVEMTV
jgi:hypothetical protein